MINFDGDIERFDYASRGEEVRDSLIAMFEHIQEILSDKSVYIEPKQLIEWLSSGIYEGEPQYLDDILKDAHPAVRSGVLYERFGNPIHFIKAHGDRLERLNWVENQYPRSKTTDYPGSLYEPYKLEFSAPYGKPVEFEPGWYAEGHGRVIYPTDVDYITVENFYWYNDFRLFYDVPIMEYPYLMNIPITFAFSIGGNYRIEFVLVDTETGEEILANKYNECPEYISDVNSKFQARELLRTLVPDIKQYDPKWKLRVRIYPKYNGDPNEPYVVPYGRLYLERFYINA